MNAGKIELHCCKCGQGFPLNSLLAQHFEKEHPVAPNMLTDEQIADIEARANAASEGPWRWRRDYEMPNGDKHWELSNPEGDRHRKTIDASLVLLLDRDEWLHRPADTQANWQFIAHAREDIPALCATVKHLRAENELWSIWHVKEPGPCGHHPCHQYDLRKIAGNPDAAHGCASCEVIQLQSQLEQLRAENGQIVTQRDASEAGRDVMTNEKAPERVWINSVPESGRVTAYVSPIREVGSGRSLSLAEYFRADLLAAARKEEREAAFKEAIEIAKGELIPNAGVGSTDEDFNAATQDVITKLEAAALTEK